jgi:hypothetical protein
MTDSETNNIKDPLDKGSLFDVEKWTTKTKAELLTLFDNIEPLDLSDEETREDFIALEKKAYEAYGYPDNVEGNDYFSRISEYENNSFIILGIRDPESRKLKYYMDVYTLSPEEKVFPESQEQDFYDDIENREEFLRLPGLVFNKILKDPEFNEKISTGTKLQLYLIRKLLEDSNDSIRIEEQCQPASYRFFKVAERLGYVEIIKDIKIENESYNQDQTEVNRILVKIDPKARTLNFLRKNTPKNEES